jgi:hypothetical protein
LPASNGVRSCDRLGYSSRGFPLVSFDGPFCSVLNGRRRRVTTTGPSDERCSGADGEP